MRHDAAVIGSRFHLDPSVRLRLHVDVDPALPVASWLATVDGGTVAVVCGRGVERSEIGVAEGCWDDPFEAFDLDRAANVFGSGIRMREDAVAFIAPSHTLEGLYVHECPDRLVVSNSLVFLLEHEQLQVPSDLALCAALAQVALGTGRYPQVLTPTERGHLARFFDATLRLHGGRLDLQSRGRGPRFADFAAYRAHLVETLRRVAANGADPRRTKRYDLLTTVSSGYDSTACAALVREVGGTRAVTLTRSRFGRSDSGENVGRSLGLDVTAFDRSAACAGADPTCMAEFVATGYGGEDLPFASFEEHLAGHVVVTGFVGGTVWTRSAELGDALHRKDLSGSSLGEFRLRVGFAHVPLPFVGALSGADIAAITRSEELRAYTLGTSNDKPIARRIAEEAGVPRSSFGQTKEAVSVLGFTHFGAWPSAARASVEAFVGRHATIGHRVGQLWWTLRSYAWRSLRKGLRMVGRPAAGPRLERAILSAEWVVFEHSAPITSELAFRWALAEVRPRYAGRHARRTEGGPSAHG